MCSSVCGSVCVQAASKAVSFVIWSVAVVVGLVVVAVETGFPVLVTFGVFVVVVLEGGSSPDMVRES